MSTVISAIGGLGECMNVVIGGKINLIDKRKYEWNVFKSYNNSKFLVKTVNEIFNFPDYIEKKEDIILFLKTLFNKSTNEIFNSLIRSFIINKPLQIAYKNLFWKIKEFIENIIILNLPKDNKKNTLLEWETYIYENNIDTSSVILWILFNKKSPFNEIDNINFEYLGYCPYIPQERICTLLKFPFDNYKDCINKYIDLNKFKNKIERLLSYDDFCKFKLNTIYTKIDINNDNLSNDEIIMNYVEHWFSIAEKMKNDLEKKEKEYIKLAKLLNLISKEYKIQTDKLNKINKLD
jgi:hypothetical protein